MPAKGRETVLKTKRQTKPGWYGLASHLALMLLILFLVPSLSHSSPWASALGYIPPICYWFLATVITLTAVFMKRKYVWAHIAVWLVAFPLYTGFTLRLPRPQPESGTTLRVMTINALGDRCDIQELAAYIKKGNIDAVMLQESQMGEGDVTEVLASRLPGYRAFYKGETGILTRLPASSHSFVRIPAPYPRYVVRVTAEWNDSPIELMSAHWTIPPFRGDLKKILTRIQREDARRAEQIKITLSEVDQLTNPVVLAGDFNTPRLHAQLNGLRARFTNAWEAGGSGWGYTFSARRPITRIDHIWSDKNWKVRRCIVGPSFGADHRSVIADLELMPTRN